MSSRDPTRDKSNYIPHILRFHGKSNAAQDILRNSPPWFAIVYKRTSRGSFDNDLLYTNGNGPRRYKYVVVKYNTAYCAKDNSPNTYSETDHIIRMDEFLSDHIYVEFGGHVYQQTDGIPMGTNCAPLVADLFLYSYEADFVQQRVSSRKKIL